MCFSWKLRSAVAAVVLVAGATGQAGGLREPFSTEDEEDARIYLRHKYESAIQELGKLEDTIPRRGDQAACAGHFSKFFARGSAELRVLYGYGDEHGGSVVTDPLEREELVRALAAPCSRVGVQTCGFVRQETDSGGVGTVVTKRFTDPGGTSRQLRLLVANPAVSTDDARNRLDPAQPGRSRQVADLFVKGFEEANGILYLGHNRVAGGPDFFLPRRLRNDEIDYRYYRAWKPGMAEVRRGLSIRNPEMRMLALLGCHTTRTFWPDLKPRNRARNQDLEVFSTHSLIGISDQARELMRILNGLMNSRCEYAYYNIHRRGDVLRWLPRFTFPRDIVDIRAPGSRSFLIR